MGDHRFFNFFLGEEGSWISYLLIPSERLGFGFDLVIEFLAVEHLGDFVGLFLHIDILEKRRIDGFRAEIGIHQGRFDVNVIGVIGHLEIDFTGFEGFTGGEIESLPADILNCRGIEDHRIHILC